MAYRDIVIVGSGFGGAVMAARLGEQVQAALGGRYTVQLLDKGADHVGRFDPDADRLGAGLRPLNAQGNRFRHTLDPDYLADVGEVFTDPSGAYRAGVPSMNVIAGTGVGGGSNLDLGVSLRAPLVAAEQLRDGRRLWPASFSRASLDDTYGRVEAELRVSQMRWPDADAPHWQLATKRDYVFADGCRRRCATAAPLKLATHRDANEGWWSQGQRFAGRQTLTENYLSRAQAAGVAFRSLCEVEEVRPTADGYVVTGLDRRSGQPQPFELECRVLVLAAGAVASTALLLRSEDHFEGERAIDPGRAFGIPRVLGRHVSANGDYGVSGIVGADYAHAVEGHKGKPMSSFCPSFFPEHQFIIIPFFASPLYLSLGQFSTLQRPEQASATGRGATEVQKGDGGLAEPDWGLDYKRRLESFGARMLTMGCLALDDCEGEVVASDGHVGVQWRETSRRTEQRWSTAVDAMRRIYAALGGEMYLDAYRKDGTVSTAHPLGGCRMAGEGEEREGIVNPAGEVFRNSGLFVADGAIIPSALGVNPSLTIAAVAESIAEGLITGSGTASLGDRLDP